MCSMWADGYNGVVKHLEQRASFGVVVEGDVEIFRSFAAERGWSNLRLLSSGGSSMKDDLKMQSPTGAQLPGASVFTRDPDGSVRHFYTVCAFMKEGHFRGMDLLSPVWNFLDLTPEGRGDWLPSLEA